MRLAIAAGLALALSFPAHAQTACVTVEVDRAILEQAGWQWLAERPAPFADGTVVYYRLPDGTVWASGVIGGCVSPEAYLIGKYVAEVGA